MTPTPPYVFPQQRPTDESADGEGDILIKSGSCRSFYWRTPDSLQDGDTWVPGCDEFFQDHGESVIDVRWKMTCADNKWGSIE